MSGRQKAVRESVLDRLLDEANDIRPGSLRAAHVALQRDLSALLNARRAWTTLPDRLAPLRRTILGYGLPEFSSGAFNEPDRRQALRREIAQTIRDFEPRLSDVTVTLLDRADSMDPVLRIRISAVLQLEDYAEPIDFETSLNASTASMTVQDAGRG